MRSMRWRRERSAAFTLGELLVAAGVAGVIAAVCMTSFVAFQRCYELSMARSGVRTNVVRLFDALEIDLRNATTVTANVSGSVNVLPLTLSIPQRYSDYEPAAAMAGDPSRTGTRLEPEFDPKTGKLGFPRAITVTYALVDAGTATKNLTREVRWTPLSGPAKTATRVIATVPADTAITFQNPSGGLLTTEDLALVARVSARSNSKAGRSSAPIAAVSTIYLRTKSIR
jgi:hypothetical protein